MKRKILFLLPLCVLVACSQSAGLDDEWGQQPDPGIQHGMIQLG